MFYRLNYFTLFLLAALTLAACRKPLARKNEIFKIEFATSGSGKKPKRALSIDSSLTVKYYADNVYTPVGSYAYYHSPQYYKGTISRALWDTLTNKLEQLKYRQLDSVGDVDPNGDGQGAEFIICSKAGRKRFTRLLRRRITPMDAMTNWLIALPGKLKLHEQQDSIHFDTHYQKKHSATQ